MILRAEAITFAYDRVTPVLREVSLELPPGQVVGLFGPNGSGKSTLLRCLNGSLQPQSGRVLLDERPIVEWGPKAIARHVAVVPQDTPSDVPLTVRQMVMLGRYPHGSGWDQDAPEDAAIVNESLARMDLTALADRPFHHLSGGERQRAVIARALAQRGRVLLLDEPNLHLDLAHQLEVYRLARTAAAEGQAVLVICHDLLISPLMVHLAAVIDHGQIVALGPPHAVLDDTLLRRVFAAEAGIGWEAPFQVRATFTL